MDERTLNEILRSNATLIKIQAYQEAMKLKRESLENKKINGHGYSVYSMHDQDGILNRIFNIIGVNSKMFLEFGCGDGSQNNTLNLLFSHDWSGLWIDGNEDCNKKINSIKSQFKNNENLTVCHSIIERNNIDELLKSYTEDLKPDLLVIDLDWNDLYIWKEIKSIRPRVVCIEYNSHFPPPIDIIVPYSENHNPWNGTNIFGASLQTIVDFADEIGYGLVSCSLAGSDAFFVDKKTGDYDAIIKNELFFNSLYTHLDVFTIEYLYEPARFHLTFDMGHNRHHWPNEEFVENSKKFWATINNNGLNI